MLDVQHQSDVVQEPGFATVGRPVRTASLNQPQMTLPHHQPLQDLELISSAALLQAHVAAQAQAQNNAAQSAGGSGSVVYENSYNSFQRLVFSSKFDRSELQTGTVCKSVLLVCNAFTSSSSCWAGYMVLNRFNGTVSS
ncbi:hypothetical protein TSMEX_000619 [Taenia solium]|eukprot:TsM_001028500 transcript=TsM_001028500 gene=TsM_001028500